MFDLEICSPPPRALSVPDLPRDVVPVYVWLLQEHVEASLVLGQGMSGDLVDEGLQTGPPLLDEALLVDAVVAAKGKLALKGLAGKRRNNDLEEVEIMQRS